MRTRYRFLLLIAVFALVYFLGCAQTSLGQRPKTQPNRKAKPIASETAVKTPDSTDAFSEVLRKLLANTPDGFSSLRKTGPAPSNPNPGPWNTDIRFPGAFGDCAVFSSGDLSEVTCPLQSDSRQTLAAQDRDHAYEQYCDQLVRLLPADWTVNLKDFDSSSRQQIGALPSTEDRNLRFFAPGSEMVAVNISESSPTLGMTLITLSVTKFGTLYKAGFQAAGLQTVGELRNAVPSRESVIGTIRENARLYNLKSLKAEMLWQLDRYREAAETCNRLAPEPWFCELVKKEAVRPRSDADARSLYQAGKYEQALVASTLVIQKMRNSFQNDGWTGWTLASWHQQRALIEAAVGQIEGSLQDFNKAVAIKSALAPTVNSDLLLEFHEAIVLYMYGARSAGEQACAQAAKVSPNLSALITDLCDKMKNTAVSQLRANMMTAQPATNSRYPNLMTFHNPSDFDLAIKLLGPSSEGFALPRGKDVSLNVAAGEYRILIRYTNSDRNYVYAKGGPFKIAEASTAHSETKITLPKYPKTDNEAQNQFEAAQIAISDRPLTEVENAAGANGNFHFARAITSSEGRITSLSFSPDAHMLAVGGVNSIKMWDVENGQELWNVPENSGKNVAFSPDGKLLALELEDGSHSVIQLLEPATNKTVRQLGRAKSQSLITFSSDGRRVAVSSRDTIQVSDASTGQTFYSVTSKKDMIGSVAFSPDGHWLASGGKNGIILWETADGKRLKDFAVGEFVAFSPDGQIIASASSQNITLWNLATGQVLYTLAGRAPVAFDQDSHWLASRSADGRSAKVWNVATGEEVANLGDPSDEVTSIAFSPDGQWLASASEYDTVWLWRRSSRKDAGLQMLTPHDSTKK